MKEFNINYNGVKFLEKKLNLFLKNNLKNKKYSFDDYNRIKNLINNEYSLPKDAVNIKNSKDYIDKKGNIYKPQGNTGLYIKAKTRIHLRYVVCAINYNDGIKNEKLHRVLAKTFIENTYNKPCVNHIDGNKLNNDLSNLEWCTISENTKHAFDNKLIINKKGYEDSQSFPVYMYDLYTDKIIKDYGSISLASKDTGIPINTILNHCKQKVKPRKHKVYFRYQ